MRSKAIKFDTDTSQYYVQVQQRYSKQLCLSPDMEGVFEDDGGILMSTKALAAYQVITAWILLFILS